MWFWKLQSACKEFKPIWHFSTNRIQLKECYFICFFLFFIITVVQLHGCILSILARMSKQLLWKKNVLWLPLQGVMFCGYHCRECTNTRSMQIFHIFSGTSKILNCSIYGNNILKSSTISLSRKKRNHIRNRSHTDLGLDAFNDCKPSVIDRNDYDLNDRRCWGYIRG